MKKTKIVCLLSLLTLASSCSGGIDPAKSSSSEEEYPLSSVEVALSKKLDSKAYMLSLKKYTSLPTYFFTFDEDVPYVSLNNFLLSFFNEAMETPLYVLGEDGNLCNANTKATLKCSLEKNSLTFSDYDQFFSFFGLSIPGDIFSTSNDPLSKFNEEKSSYVSGGPLTFKLGKYNARLISYEEQTYIPFSYIETMVFSSLGTRFVFNGDDYFLATSSAVYQGDQLTDYGKALYNGSLSKKTGRNESYSNYFYNSFLFEMENYYGKFDELGISNLDQTLEEAGLKEKLLSYDSKIADEAVAETINTYFGDGGHTAFYHRGLTVPYSYVEDATLMAGIVRTDERLQGIITRMSNLKKLYESSGATNFDVSGSTAALRFNSFSLNQNGASPDKINVKVDYTSTFGFLYNNLAKLALYPNVTNVVLDVSLNGGGYAMALAHALSFMTDDAVTITVKNPLTGSYYTEAVDYDNDFDGDFTDKDSYAGKYNFYILTSGYSFSCGNAFPCIAKENGYAKIIGETSGGGDCAVSSAIGVDGTAWQMSSNSKLVHTNDHSTFDKGAEVDVKLEDEAYYNIAKLDSVLSNLSK